MKTGNLPVVSLVGVSGYGKLYYSHLIQMHDENRIHLRDAVVVNPEETIDECRALLDRGVAVFGSVEEMMDSQPASDWVCLPVGIPLHRKFLEMSLNWGAGVLLEKPVAGSVEDWEAMVKMAEQSERPVWIGFQHAHDPGVRKLKRELISGEWGKVMRLDVKGSWPRDEVYYSRNPWAGKRELRGIAVMDSPVQNAFAHYVHIACHFAGGGNPESACPISVTGDLWKVRPELEMFDECQVRFMLEGDIPFDLNLTHAHPEKMDPQVRMEAENGWVVWEHGQMHGVKSGVLFDHEIDYPPHGNMFTELLVEGSTGCSIQEAGVHLKAVDLLDRHLDVKPSLGSRFEI